MQQLDIEKLDIVAPGLVDGTRYREAEVLGSTIWLWSHSAEHEDIPVKLLPILLFPAITQQQFVLIFQDKQPIFFAAWANLNEESEYRYLKNPAVYMKPEDWVSGDRLWFTDWVSPFGHSFAITRFFQRGLFKDQCGRGLYHRGNERGFRIVNFRGVNISQQAFDDWQQQYPVCM